MLRALENPLMNMEPPTHDKHGPMERAEPTLWLRRILVAVDFSPGTASALNYAAALATEFGATVTLLHVVQLNIAGEERGVPRTQFLGELGHAAERRLRSLARSVFKSRIACDVEVRSGSPIEEILGAAGDCNADLILMSRHSKRWLLELLRPSVAERVQRAAACPVLVVGARHQPFVWRLASVS